MAFETGYASNEFELQRKLDDFIVSTLGWTRLSQININDAVYFSSGEDGFKDIYIRVVAGAKEEPPTYGKDQFDFGDGYTGYLNFFAYQWFPQDGGDADGYGMAGKLGPLLYWLLAGGEYDVYYKRMASDTGFNRINYLRNQAIPGDPTDNAEFSADMMYYTDAAFDGKRYFYYWSPDSTFGRFDLAAERYELIDERVEGGADTNGGLVYYVDPRNRKEYVWFKKQDGGVANLDDGTADLRFQNDILKRWDVSNKVMQYGFSGPEWSGDREGINGEMIWDGQDHLYAMRGTFEQEWAKYHIPTDTWTVFEASQNLPVTVARNDNWIFLNKAHSGFTYSRIYAVLDSLYYIDIDDNTGNPIGSWTSAGTLPKTPQLGAYVFHNRKNRFYYWPGDASGGREMYYADMTSGTLSWTLADSTFLPESPDGENTAFYYVDGYASRVRVSLFDRTKYWFMGNKDRITVATKSDDEYSFCYMGIVSQNTPLSPHALNTSDVHPGSNVVIPLNILKGEFEIGKTMFIADITDRGGMEYMATGSKAIENIPRKFKPMEMFTITDVDPGVSITADQINGYYPSGSRVAFDPQPVGITLGELDRIQMLNHANTVLDFGSVDMGENMAKLDTVREELVNASGNDSRRGKYYLWPINVVNTGSDAGSSGVEARGNLIGVFAVSGSAGISSEDTISVGPNTYIILNVGTGKSFLYAFGPINNND